MTNDSRPLKKMLQNLLPGEVHGWEAEGEDEFYDPQTIYDYIDGAGEVYRAYNFQLLLARRYVREGQTDLVVDLFDMGSSRDAFGVFTHDLEGEDAGVGQGSTYKGGLLSFWRDRYFVSVYAEEETGEAKKALDALGRKVASAIGQDGEMPEIVSLLPQDSLAEKTVHYFHNHLILNYHFYVADDNILLLDQQTEVALGVYRENAGKWYRMVVRYPEEGQALRAYESFSGAYLTGAREPGLVQTEDRKWTAVRIRDSHLVIVFDAPTAGAAKEAVEEVVRKLDQE